MMDKLLVHIRRFVDEHFPGFVESVFADAEGCEHQFIEKTPVVSTANLSSDSVMPERGYIACVVQDEWVDERGRQLVRVDTDEPWGVQSVAGKTTFVVLREQVVRG